MYTPNWSKRRHNVEALVYHWTGGTFKSAVSWCLADESEVSYHTVISPEGTRRDLLAFDEWKTKSAWSVGTGREPDGFPVKMPNPNHYSISVALAGGPTVLPTEAAFNMAVAIGLEVFHAMKWTSKDLWRVVGHIDLATFPKEHPKAGQFGRKQDPWVWKDPKGVEHVWLDKARLLSELERLLKLTGV